MLQRKKLEIIQHCKQHLFNIFSSLVIKPSLFLSEPPVGNYELWVNRYCNTFEQAYFITYIFVVFLMAGMRKPFMRWSNKYGKLYIFFNVEPVDSFPSF